MPGSLRKSQYTKYPSQPLSPALHYLPLASHFPLPHFTIAILFALSLYPPSLSLFASFLPFALSAVLSEIGEIIVDMDNNNIMKIFDAPAKEPPILHTKKSVLVVVILLEKELFKISLLVSVLYLLWVVLSFIELVVLRMLLPCL